ncbi:Uncharacterised protein [Vibrio cholerae]|nr:Uncharacterised protein [Vibrio cholerae]
MRFALTIIGFSLWLMLPCVLVRSVLRQVIKWSTVTLLDGKDWLCLSLIFRHRLLSFYKGQQL